MRVAFELLHAKKLLYLLEIGRIYQTRFAKVSFLLCSLFSQNMTVESVLSLDFTCSGKSESFFGTGVSFNFWHFVNYLIINVIATHYAARCNLSFLLGEVPREFLFSFFSFRFGRSAFCNILCCCCCL